jgi:hypothetical protein
MTRYCFAIILIKSSQPFLCINSAQRMCSFRSNCCVILCFFVNFEDISILKLLGFSQLVSKFLVPYIAIKKEVSMLTISRCILNSYPGSV